MYRDTIFLIIVTALAAGGRDGPSLLQSALSLPASPFPPLAAAFMGLGTGDMIYGTEELSGYPRRRLGSWGGRAPGFFHLGTGF